MWHTASVSLPLSFPSGALVVGTTSPQLLAMRLYSSAFHSSVLPALQVAFIFLFKFWLILPQHVKILYENETLGF